MAQKMLKRRIAKAKDSTLKRKLRKPVRSSSEQSGRNKKASSLKTWRRVAQKEGVRLISKGRKK